MGQSRVGSTESVTRASVVGAFEFGDREESGGQWLAPDLALKEDPLRIVSFVDGQEKKRVGQGQHFGDRDGKSAGRNLHFVD